MANERTTKAEVGAVFGRFLTVTGQRAAQSWDDVGGLALDHNSIYGGYVVTRVENTGGGISHPFGEQRRSPREFVSTLHFAIRVAEDGKR